MVDKASGFGNSTFDSPETEMGHTWWVTSVAWSPDGKRILSASHDKTLVVWDVETRQKLWEFIGHTDGVTACAWSADGKHIVSGSWNGTLRLWDAETGDYLLDYFAHNDSVISVALSPDGKRILSGSRDKTLMVWDTETGSKIWEFSEYSNDVSSCAWSPDGKYVLATYMDGTFRGLDARSGDLIWEYYGDESWVNSVAWSPDGKYVVSGSWNGALRILDVHTGELLCTIKGHTDGVNSVAWSPDGKRILSASHDNTLKVWDANTGKEIRTLKGHNWWVTSCAWSSDGKRILSSSMGGTLIVWDADTGAQIEKYSEGAERVVSTGFSTETQAEKPVDPFVPLKLGCYYYFWLEVGPPVPGSIEVTPGPLAMEFPPPRPNLKVVLFAYENEIEIFPGSEIGEMKFMPNGKVRVARQVVRPDAISPDSEILSRRLFFPIRVPRKEGMFRLRCNIYYEQVLVQSRLVQVHVARDPQLSTAPKLQSFLTEYTISKTLNPHYLERIRPQKLSLELNDNGDGTHCFRLFGEKDYISDVSFNAEELKKLVRKARGAFRNASWGDEEPWVDGKRYRYAGKYSRNQLKADLIRFAIRGYRFYYGLISKIKSHKLPDVEKLEELTRKPAIIEFVIRDKTEAATYIFPTSMIYDYPLNTRLPFSKYTLCPSFLKALEEKSPLEKSSCFKGNCPSKNADSVVCPSGFWGFRHSIGMPYGSASETNPVIPYRITPNLTVALSLDLDEWALHQKKLKELMPAHPNFSETSEKTLRALKESKSQVIYFYCHGGLAGDLPYIKVGKKDEMGITPDNLFHLRLWWDSPQPLVFLNGCHTTALHPGMTVNFVTGLIKIHNASGVVGTEITIFESLARDFAEDCLVRFLVDGKTIGESVRETRLKLLKGGNPLGLVYNIYANANLQLSKTG